MAKKSLKNSKHLVELIESATLPALALLLRVDKFAFLPALDALKSDAEAKAGLIGALPQGVRRMSSIRKYNVKKPVTGCHGFQQAYDFLVRLKEIGI